MARPSLVGMGDPDIGLTITWHGHACFTLRDSLNRTVVIDPFDETVGYGVLTLRADTVLISHAHFDHNHLRSVRPRRRSLFDVFEGTGTRVVAGDMSVQGIESFHDDEAGAVHGPNTIYAFTMAGLRIVHLGDFGQKELTPAQRAQLGPVDILFIPVGGVVTIGSQEAERIVQQLNPRAVFPMHYGDIRFARLQEARAFTERFPTEQVHISSESSVQIRASMLAAEPHVYVLSPVLRNY